MRKFWDAIEYRIERFTLEMQQETGLSVVEMILILVGNFTPYLGCVLCG